MAQLPCWRVRPTAHAAPDEVEGTFTRTCEGDSERTDRYARIYSRAAEVFGDRERGYAWMDRPNPVLDGYSPSDYLDTEAGARHVETLLGRLEHGIAG